MSLEMPVGDDISALADWVELRIASSSADMPLTRLDRLLKAEGSELADEELADSEPDGTTADGNEELEVRLDLEDAAAAEIDVRVEQISEEIRLRGRTSAKVYPYAVDADRVTPREACGAEVYYLLLVLGTKELPFRSERRAHQVEEAFDHIAMAALRRLLGRDADGLRFARTARATDSEIDREHPDPRRRPIGFEEAITWLRDWLDVGPGPRPAEGETDQVGHWEDADEGEPPPLGRAPLSSYNDAGVDIVVWWRFADGRAGFPVLLAQCTVQIAWEDKLEDVKLVLWEKWIDFHTVPPQRALVIPFADRRDHPGWRDRTARAGVIVDRVRLLELLEELDCTQLAALIDDATRTWTHTELAAA